MPSVISTGGQTRVPNAYASSADARLTLRVNGEENGVVITPLAAVVPAGFNAPTVAPVAATGAAGNVAEGYYVYRYVYASSRYPFVENAVTGGGEQWPRSNPSPASNTLQVTGGAKQVAITVTYSTRSDVDWIWVYRTSVQTSATLAEAQDAAGELFYVGRVANNTAGGTGTFTDNTEGDTAEEMEADNFECPLFRYTVYDGTYWWGFGVDTLEVIVDMDSSTTFSIHDGLGGATSWFSGRDTTPAGFNGSSVPGGNSINFLGVTTGGYDGRGTFYFKTVTQTTGQAFNAPAVTVPVAIPVSGTTTAYLTGPGTTLYRSKPNNPFSWGDTPTIISAGQTIEVPQLWAEKIGGGVGTAISLIPNERILKLDTESPTKSYALDLNAAGEDTFIGTLRTLDEAQSVSSHFSQFPMRLPQGQSVGTGVNAKANQLLNADAQSQIPIGDEVIRTMQKIEPSGTTADFFHGVFDYRNELNCWVIKTTDLTGTADTLVYNHSATNTWGLAYWPGITASAMIYDPVSRQNMTFVGTGDGQLGRAFSPDIYRSWINTPRTGTTMLYNGGTVIVSQPLLAQAAVIVGFGYTAVVLTVAPHPFEANQLVAIGTSGAPSIYRVVSNDNSNQFTIELQVYTTGSIDGLYIFEPSDLAWGVWYSATRTYLARITGLSIQLVTGGTVSSTATLAGGIDLQTGESVTPEANVVAYDAYVGAMPCLLRRYLTASSPERDKKNVEVWTTILNVDSDTDKRYVAYYLEYQGTQAEASRGILTQDKIGDGSSGSDAYFDKSPITTLCRSYGYEVYECGYQPLEFLDLTVKMSEA